MFSEIDSDFAKKMPAFEGEPSSDKCDGEKLK